MSTHYLGIDIGGTKTEVTLISLSNPKDFASHQVVARKRIPTDRNHGLSRYLHHLRVLIQELLHGESLQVGDLAGIGTGLPGSIHPVLQQMVQGSIPFFRNQDLKQTFRSHLGYDGVMVFENDANCFALAESRFGAGAAWAHENALPLSELCLLGVTLGTGVGGGIIARGELIRGRRGGAGEIGHITLREFDRPCYCGKFGCAEQFLSGPALELSYQLRAPGSQGIPGREVFRLAREQDPFATATIAAYRETLVRFLSNLSNILDPHVIVLGGGLSLEEDVYPGLEERLSEGCFLTEEPPAVLPNQLGDAGGAIGAAYLAFLERERTE